MFRLFVLSLASLLVCCHANTLTLTANNGGWYTNVLNYFEVSLSSAPSESFSVAFTTNVPDAVSLSNCTVWFSPTDYEDVKVYLIPITSYSGHSEDFTITATPSVSYISSAELSMDFTSLASGTCMAFGASHFIGFDDSMYDFHGTGDYYLARQLGGDFVVQTRRSECADGASCNFGIAVKYLDTVLVSTISSATGTPSVGFTAGGDDLQLGNVVHGTGFRVSATNGVEVDFRYVYWDSASSYIMNYFITAPPSYNGRMTGLCGELAGAISNTSADALSAFAVPYEENLFVGNIPPALETYSDVDEGLSVTQHECTQATQVEVGSIFHTRYDSNPVAQSSAEAYITKWESLDDDNSAYCEAIVQDWSLVSNQVTCGGSRSNIMYKMSAQWTTAYDADWCFRLGADMGGGGIFMVDDEIIGWSTEDMWWAFNIEATTEVLEGCTHLSAGTHMLVSIGSEGCCDGQQTLMYNIDGNDWTTWSVDSDDLQGLVAVDELIEEEVFLNDLFENAPVVEEPEEPEVLDGPDDDESEPSEEAEEHCASSATLLDGDLALFLYEACVTDYDACGGGAGCGDSSTGVVVDLVIVENDGDEDILDALPICANGCTEGTCLDGICNCHNGYSGDSCSIPDDFPAPEILALSVYHATEQGTQVIVSGNNLQHPTLATNCHFGDIIVEATIMSQWEAICLSPDSGLTYTHDVELTLVHEDVSNSIDFTHCFYVDCPVGTWLDGYDGNNCGGECYDCSVSNCGTCDNDECSVCADGYFFDTAAQCVDECSVTEWFNPDLGQCDYLDTEETWTVDGDVFIICKNCTGGCLENHPEHRAHWLTHASADPANQLPALEEAMYWETSDGQWTITNTAIIYTSSEGKVMHYSWPDCDLHCDDDEADEDSGRGR